MRFSNGGSGPLTGRRRICCRSTSSWGLVVENRPDGVATTRKIGRYELELIGEELLQTPVRLMRTLHFRAPEKDDRGLAMPGDHLLPVKSGTLTKRRDLRGRSRRRDTDPE